MQARINMNQHVGVCRRLWMTASLIAGLTLSPAAMGRAEPPDDPAVSPYPDRALILNAYNRIDPEQFFIPNNYGAWFLSPTGLNCGISDKGAFGCEGDIPGAPPGVHDIGWFNGNKAVHYGWTAAVQFRPGQAVQPLPPRSYMTFNGTTCAVTVAGGTYCNRGQIRFFITPTQTWLNG
jgi:hypothetical protein